ncbi:putative C6 transcription factor [Aspergillus aculeatinus CBS 121060]|uniref:C6 zinc finger domain protein n=1 Tax=Aspergillus aculeatinus CBS 121060 TaxID=1448322 RepID=A0ACD1GR89_9EURO|nr:C6 zinc finger domain protein [Aspergillus aculeatinus CBS 121060]RAH63829.1 C6 zinc finger domain protein [Aspergillus aculeatinus CBS 121060]
MESDDSSCVRQLPTGKKRIPKACSACRQSKVRCDGKRPCSRCKRSYKQCIFYEVPKDPTTERLENVESEVQRLRAQIEAMGEIFRLSTQQLPPEGLGQVQHAQGQFVDQHRAYPAEAPFLTSNHAASHSGGMSMLSAAATSALNSERGSELHPQRGLPSSSQIRSAMDEETVRPVKRKRSGFEVKEEPISDFVSQGLMTADQAVACFRTFFQGCDRYIPIFDPEVDTFTSVRSRSSILLNAICTIGSRVGRSPGSQFPDLLHAELKKWIGIVIQNKNLNCLESVQALLIVACYTAERSLMLSFATRMALDLGLDEAFEELIQLLTLKRTSDPLRIPGDSVEAQVRCLMRKSRTWFGLLVLDHIFHVDGGKPPGIRMMGNARRCRILLHHPSSTVLDMRLFSQVELNVIRANINDTLDIRDSLTREAIAEFVHEVKVDLHLWFDDWQRIIVNSQTAQDERPFLLAALSVQHCWAELILHCKALRSMGVENVAAIAPVELNILSLAKSAARQHLRLISLEPAHYLAKLKYAMDFVWAKCAFCFLLLLKLSRLLPEQRDEHEELLQLGNKLLWELTRAPAVQCLASGTGTGLGNVYMHILRLSIEKYSRIFQGQQRGERGAKQTSSSFWDLFDAQVDLQSFVPEQFVRDWNFPGLNLFYFPTAWQDFFGDFSLGFGS